MRHVVGLLIAASVIALALAVPSGARAVAIHQAIHFSDPRLIQVNRSEAKLVTKEELTAFCGCPLSWGTSEPGPRDLVWVVALAGDFDWAYPTDLHHTQPGAGYVILPLLPIGHGSGGFTNTYSWPPFFADLRDRTP